MPQVTAPGFLRADQRELLCRPCAHRASCLAADLADAESRGCWGGEDVEVVRRRGARALGEERRRARLAAA